MEYLRLRVWKVRLSLLSHLPILTFWLQPIGNFTHWRKGTQEKRKYISWDQQWHQREWLAPIKRDISAPPILISTEEDETIFLLLFLDDSNPAVFLPVMFSLWYIYTTCHSICNFHLKLSRVVKSPLPAILAVKCAPWRKRATPPLYNTTLLT